MFKKSFYLLISTAFLTMTAFARLEPPVDDNQMQMDNMGDGSGQFMDQPNQYDDQAQGMSGDDLSQENMPNNDMGNSDQSMADGQDLGDNQNQDDGQPQDMANDQGYTDSEMHNNDSQETGPSVNVAVNSKVNQAYQTKATNQNIQYQLHLQIFEGPKDNAGSDAFRQDINIAGGDQFAATFDNYDKQPGQLLVAISKPGNKIQMFCLGKNMKDGRINGVPQQIEVTLDTPKNYAMKNGDIKNNTYPKCTVTY